MPGGDRTGPLGKGPMTGRQLGYGAGYDTPGFMKGRGPGLRMGFFGRGPRWGYIDRDNQPDAGRSYTDHYVAKLEALKSQVEQLKASLDTILNRLNKK